MINPAGVTKIEGIKVVEGLNPLYFCGKQADLHNKGVTG